MVLLVGTNQSTLWKPATLRGLTWWNKPEHSEETSNLAWSYLVEQTRALCGNQQPYMVEQTRALCGNQQPCMVLHGGTNQSTLRKPATIAALTWWNTPEHSEETSSTLRKLAPWHGLTWCNKPVHSEETSSLSWSYMLIQTRDL